MVFVLLKDEMKQGEKTAMSREIAHLVSKKQRGVIETGADPYCVAIFGER